MEQQPYKQDKHRETVKERQADDTEGERKVECVATRELWDIKMMTEAAVGQCYRVFTDHKCAMITLSVCPHS